MLVLPVASILTTVRTWRDRFPVVGADGGAANAMGWGGAVELEDAFRRHQRELYLYLLKVTGDRALAEDLAQDTFLRAFQGALTFRGDATLRTWLFAIARNVLISHQRRQRPVEAEWVTEPSPSASARDPSTAVGTYETLARLPLPAREALVLSDLLGFEPHEAAELVGVTANAFRVRLHRARTQFREIHGHG